MAGKGLLITTKKALTVSKTHKAFTPTKTNIQQARRIECFRKYLYLIIPY